MAHIRKPLAAAVALNTAIFIVEAIAGYQANSLSLLMDSVHNFSDELALVFLFLAYRLSVRFSGHLLRSANLLNSIGLIVVSGIMVWQAIERILHPAPVIGFIPVLVGVASAVGNWGVARILKKWGEYSTAIRLAYVHNMGDIMVSLVPVAAGILTMVFHRPIFDAIIALVIAVWLTWSTFQEMTNSGSELLWPKDAICPHDPECSDAA